MVRYLASIGLLLSVASSVLAQSDRPPVVAVLRDSEPAFNGADIDHDHAVLLDSEANVVRTISRLGGEPIAFAPKHVAARCGSSAACRGRELAPSLVFFDYAGVSQQTIPIENASAIALTD
jgi:hypothetical protein